MVGDTRVDVAGLRELGGRLRVVGEAAGHDLAAATGRLTGPAGAGGGTWATDAALRAAAAGWQDYLREVTTRVDRAATALVDAAQGYRAADDRAAGRVGGRPYQ